jgi:NADP-dependent 3-hydroxy acid dehydrogenase YdfG
MTSKPTRGLEGRIAVVTGASSGIGEAVAREIVSRGGRVVINARREERLDALVLELNEGRREAVAVGIAGDAAEDEVIASMLDAAGERFGGEADAVVVNAGRGLNGSVFTSDASQWEAMIRTNLLGAARLMRAAAQRMVKDVESRGADGWRARAHDIVAIGSTVGRHISPFSSMYGSTKFGVHALGEALRREIGPRGVRVTVIAPAVVRSEFQDVAGYDRGTFGAFMEKIGPVLEPSDVAGTIGFVLEQPSHVHVCDVVVRPTRQDYP